MKKNISLEDLPSLVFRDYIFEYLSPMDIFNLGQCSKSLKNLVLSEVIHPVSTELQCIKTKYKHLYKLSTVYDDIDRFRLIDKCCKDTCECNKFRQRKDWVIMDPACCPSCDEYFYNDTFYCADSFKYSIEPCIYHCTLMTEILELKLCNDCYIKKDYCLSCKDVLEK